MLVLYVDSKKEAGKGVICANDLSTFDKAVQGAIKN
jgi:hypothetical protein